MKLLVTLENHFSRDAQGHVYSSGPPAYSFWLPYLEHFEEVAVLARIKADSSKKGSQPRADGPRVTFLPLVDYRGPSEYLRRQFVLRRQVRKAVQSCDAYILRVPGLVGRAAATEICRLNRRFAVEVVADPWQALAPGTWPSVFTPIYRRILTRNLRTLCRDAFAVRYVSRKVLPEAYPASPAAFSTVFSDVELGAAIISTGELEHRLQRTVAGRSRSSAPFRLGFVGSFAQRYKGADVLLEAVARLRANGLNVEVDFAGDGATRPAMEAMARKLGIAEHAHFLGMLPFGNAVYDFLDTLDLFVMPSRTEGLPRAMLEAMARGCPCVGSNVGGIPELLPPEDLVPANEPQLLARKIEEVIRDPARMGSMSERNFEVAKTYRLEIITSHGRAFYRAVREGAERHSKPDFHKLETATAVRVPVEGNYYSIHGLVTIVISKSHSHRHALELELEPFRLEAGGAWDLLVTPTEEQRGFDFRPVHPRGLSIAFQDGRIQFACDRDPISFVFPLVQWLLIQKSHSLVHAAGLGLNGKGVLLPAAGGVGKTAAVQKLCSLPHSSFLGDDLVFLSAKPELLSYPKPLFIYPYHRELFPHVFAQAQKFVVPISLMRSVGAVRRLVRPLLRAFPRVEDFGRRYTPEHIHTQARVALPETEFSTRLPLSLVLYLERYPGHEVRLEKLDIDAYSTLMTEILIREMGVPAGELLNECFQLGLMSKEKYFSAQKMIFQNAMRSCPSYKLLLPDNLLASATGETICEIVQQLLGASRTSASYFGKPAGNKVGGL